MTVTISADELAQVPGGATALDAFIAAHLPADLDYSGAKSTSDGGLTATFTLTFGSVQEYQQKVTDINAAGWAAGMAPGLAVNYSTSDTPFHTGLMWVESFSSQDLMAWLPKALLDQGLITTNQFGVFFSLGPTTVTWDGKTYDQDSGNISIDNVADRGFTSVAISTTVLADGSFQRDISYTAPTLTYQADPTLYDSYLKGVTPPDGQVTSLSTIFLTPGGPSDALTTWDLVFTAHSADELTALTRTALSSTQTSVSLSTVPLGVPSQTQITLQDYAECAAICTVTGVAIQETWTVPPSWQFNGWGGGADTSAPMQVADTVTFTADEGLSLIFRSGEAVHSIHVTTSISVNRSISTVIAVTVSQADADAAGEGFATTLAPDPTVGTLTTASADGWVTYTITISGAQPDDYAAKMTAYRPGGQVTWGPDPAHPGSLISSGWIFYQDLPLWDGFTGQVGQGIVYEIDLPWTQTITGAGPASLGVATIADHSITWTDSGAGGLLTNTFVLPISELRLTSLLIAGTGGLIVLATVILLIVFRKRVAAGFARPAAGQSPSPTEGPDLPGKTPTQGEVPGQGETAGTVPVVSPAVPPEVPPEFHESDMV